VNRSVTIRPLSAAAFPFFIAAAVAIGLFVAYDPVLASAAVIGFTVFLLAALSPERMSYVVYVASVVSFQYLFDLKLAGMDLQSFYKIGILFISLPALIHYGIYRRLSVPILALLALLPITYLFSDMHPLLTMSAPIKAFIGLAAPFVLLLIRWPRKVSENHIALVCIMPLLSIAFGIVLQAAGLHPISVTEFNGAFRLQGANIPAHLAFLAFIGFLVSLIEIKRRPERMTLFYSLMSVNFIILLLTGTRGPLLAALATVFLFVFDMFKQFLKGKAALIVPLFGFIVVLLVSVYLQLDNFKKRSFERATDSIIDTSGRSEAWAYFINGVKDSPWFGRGLGSVLVSNDGSIYSGFVVPHNEYIRFYYDGGIVGGVLLFLSLVIVFVSVYKRLSPLIRSYYVAFILGFLIYTISDNTLSTVQFIVPFLAYLNALRNLSAEKNWQRRDNDVQHSDVRPAIRQLGL
jgi:teichuronic acid biosynthesis protein TuaE